MAVRAYTGHTLDLDRDGIVFGAGGNRFGPRGAHGPDDKANRSGRIAHGAVAIAIVSRQSVSFRAGGRFRAWGDGHRIEPR